MKIEKNIFNQRQYQRFGIAVKTKLQGFRLILYLGFFS